MKPFSKSIILFIIASSLLLFSYTAAAGKWPWQRRIGKNVEVHHKKQHEERVRIEMWPAEPASPEKIDHAKFVHALRTICGPKRVGQERGKKFAAAIIEHSTQFIVDPFLIGALIYVQSRCLPKQPDHEKQRYGLSRIDVQMHAPHVRNKQYNYWILKNDQWQPQSLRTEKYPFNLWKAANPISNIYWTAAILHVLKEQKDSLSNAFTDAFKHVKYRHYVSHWFFGDNVQSTEPEDRVLTARRRMIEYYHNTQVKAAGEFNGVSLVSPLDGVPRMVLDDFAQWRGKRKSGNKHQGMDYVSELDEPIRAVADGKVIFVGVDLPNAGSKRMSGEEATAYDPRKMGDGGRYVAIKHASNLRTYYMHMDTIVAMDQSNIEAGEIIGTVGRSGSKHSGPHLHLEFRTQTGRADPAAYMQKVLVDPKHWRIEHPDH